MKGKITIDQALEYEIYSSWFASYISWSWGQELVGRYYAWKVKRKYARYAFGKNFEAKIKS